MFKKIKRQKGFTLVEMLVSMAIFMSFTGILISSYTGIIRAQRDANYYRDMYVQARQVMETMVQELRDGMVDYGNATALSSINYDSKINFVSRDGRVKTYVSYADNKVTVKKLYLNPNPDPTHDFYGLPCGDDAKCYLAPKDSDTIDLNDPANVEVSKFRLYFSPKIDPYDPKSVDYSTSQFQPRVTIYAEFTKDIGNGKTYKMDLQTTVSSRVYSQVYSTNYLYTNIK